MIADDKKRHIKEAKEAKKAVDAEKTVQAASIAALRVQEAPTEAGAGEGEKAAETAKSLDPTEVGYLERRTWARRRGVKMTELKWTATKCCEKDGTLQKNLRRSGEVEMKATELSRYIHLLLLKAKMDTRIFVGIMMDRNRRCHLMQWKRVVEKLVMESLRN